MRKGSWFDDNHPDVVGWQGGQPPLAQEAAQADPTGPQPPQQSYGDDNVDYAYNDQSGKVAETRSGPTDLGDLGSSPWQRGSIGGYLGQSTLTQPATPPGVGPAPVPSRIDNGAIQMQDGGGSMGAGLLRPTWQHGTAGPGQQVRMLGPTGQQALVPHVLVPHFLRSGAKVIG